MAVKPIHKVREVKRRTVFDKLKESALFILVLIILSITMVVSMVIWISGVLSAQPEYTGMRMVQNNIFYTWAGLAALFLVFFTTAYLVQRRAHG